MTPYTLEAGLCEWLKGWEIFLFKCSHFGKIYFKYCATHLNLVKLILTETQGLKISVKANISGRKKKRQKSLKNIDLLRKTLNSVYLGMAILIYSNGTDAAVILSVISGQQEWQHLWGLVSNVYS